MSVQPRNTQSHPSLLSASPNVTTPPNNKKTQLAKAKWTTVGHSYVGCWEVVNRLACIKLLLPSGHLGRTFNTVGVLFTEVWVASCKAMYLDTNETSDVQFGQCLFLRHRLSVVQFGAGLGTFDLNLNPQNRFSSAVCTLN